MQLLHFHKQAKESKLNSRKKLQNQIISVMKLLKGVLVCYKRHIIRGSCVYVTYQALKTEKKNMKLR